MDFILVLLCCSSPLFAILLTAIPILIAKFHIPVKYVKYKRQVKQIDTEYQYQLKKYNLATLSNEAKSQSDLRLMDPTKFEHHISHLFQRMGYSTNHIGHSGDGGVDVEARRPGEFVIIQCKRYSGNVSSPTVRNFIGAITVTKADKGYLITTGSFTAPAIKEAGQISSLYLIDIRGIMRWWQEYKIGPFSDLTPPKRADYPPALPPLPPPTILGLKIWQWIILVLSGETVCIVLFILYYVFK